MAATLDRVSTLSSTSGATSLGTNFSVNPVAGNKILLGIFGFTTATPTSVTDDGGNTYVQDKEFIPAGTHGGVWIYRADNLALPGAGTLDVTVTWAASTPFSLMAVTYGGVATGAPIATNTNAGVGDETTGNTNPAGGANSALHFAVLGVERLSGAAGIAATAPFTQRGAEQDANSFFPGAISDQLNALTQQTGIWTWTAGIDAWVAGIAAYDDANPPADPEGGPVAVINRSHLRFG